MTESIPKKYQLRPVEKERIIMIHSTMAGKEWRSKTVSESLSLNIASVQKYIVIGVKVGIFKAIFTGRKSGAYNVYECIEVDDIDDLLNPLLVPVKRIGGQFKEVEKLDGTALADLMGMKPIAHDCKPRVVINNFRGGKIERKREKVSPGGGWMVGL